MHEFRKAILLGASGLVGGRCLDQLCASPLYTQIAVIARRELDHASGRAKVTQLIVDFDRLDDWSDEITGDDVFCAFGTTIKVAGSKERFREIDFCYPAELARIARRNGAQHFSLVSSRGANPDSRVFYLRVKGELERTISGQGWPSIGILRPSVIGGERSEARPGERIAQSLLRLAPRGLRTVPAESIARAMLSLARERRPGIRIVESQDIVQS